MTDNVGTDGIDTLRHIERLQFSDVSLVRQGLNNEAEGLATIDDDTPTEDQLLTASIDGITDDDNVTPDNPTGAITGPFTIFWQMETDPGIWEDIFLEDAPGSGGETLRATGATFRPGDAQVGSALRVRVVYQDANGVLEEAFSAPTAAVANVNDDPVGTVVISDTTPTATQAILASILFTDADGLTGAAFTYQWQQSAVGGGEPFTNIANAMGVAFIPGAAQADRRLQVVVSYTDDNGTTETVTSAPTALTGRAFQGNSQANSFVGGAGDDIAFGGGGSDSLMGNGGADILNGEAGTDTILGGTGNDVITGGAGNDTLMGEAGNDTFNYAMGDGADTLVDGGADTDTLNITGGAANDVLDVVLNGTALTSIEGGTVINVERVNANLGGGTDTLNYSATSAANAVTVNLATGTASGFTSIAGIENVTGGAGNDSLTGNGLANVLSAAPATTRSTVVPATTR